MRARSALGRRTGPAMVAWALALVAAAIATLAGEVAARAQEGAREHVVATYRVDAWDRADLSWARPLVETGMVRVVVRGTLSSALDGAEIDGMRVITAARIDDAQQPLVFPDGTRLVSVRGAHEYVLDVPAGAGSTIALNVPALAGRHLVTASELRSAISGAIFVDVLSDVAPAAPAAGGPAAAATAAGIPNRSAQMSAAAVAGGALGVPLLGFALLVAARRRRRALPEDALMLRARRAQSAIVRESRELGAAFDGALASAEALGDAARRQREHLVELDRALERTAWVRAEGASAERAALLARRADATSKLEAIVARLEETVVRMAACVADRSAIVGIERDLARLRGEVEVGESVEQDLAALERG